MWRQIKLSSQPYSDGDIKQLNIFIVSHKEIIGFFLNLKIQEKKNRNKHRQLVSICLILCAWIYIFWNQHVGVGKQSTYDRMKIWNLQSRRDVFLIGFHPLACVYNFTKLSDIGSVEGIFAMQWMWQHGGLQTFR